MTAIRAEDLRDFVGGQWVRFDGGRQFQGPVLGISDGDNGEVKIICIWEAEFDPKISKCKPHNGSSVTYTLDLSYGGSIREDGSEFFHNPHVCTCAGTKEDPCYDPEHLMRTHHLYRPGSAMEIRIAGVGRRRFFTSARVIGAGITFAAFFTGMIAQDRRKKRKQEKENN